MRLCYCVVCTIIFVCQQAYALTPTPTPTSTPTTTPTPIAVLSSCQPDIPLTTLTQMIEESSKARLMRDGYKKVTVRGKLREIKTDETSPLFFKTTTLDYAPGIGAFAGPSPTGTVLYQFSTEAVTSTVSRIKFNVDGFLDANPSFKSEGRIPIHAGPDCIRTFIFEGAAKVTIFDAAKKKNVQATGKFSTEPIALSGTYKKLKLSK